MDLKQHFVFCNLFIYRLFLDQGLNLFIQTYYKELGPENAFTIWWTFFYIEHVGKRKNNTYLDTSIIYVHNYFRIKVHVQHEGLYQCKESAAGVQWFAGPEVPWPGVSRVPSITPWRPLLPPEFSEEWSRIGSRRRHQPVTIFVTPSDG